MALFPKEKSRVKFRIKDPDIGVVTSPIMMKMLAEYSSKGSLAEPSRIRVINRGRVKILNGVGKIGFDQNMRHHRVLSDDAAHDLDRKALKHDFDVVWNSMTGQKTDAI